MAFGYHADSNLAALVDGACGMNTQDKLKEWSQRMTLRRDG